MNPSNSSVRNERGIALVMALLVLMAISILAVVLMMSANTETKLSGHSMRQSSALELAEAGVAEATVRISNTEINFANNAKGTAVIFNAAAGSLPAVGVDTTAIATAQPAGAWLRYSTSGRSAEALTVKYKTDNARTVIYKYDATKNPPIQTTSGFPIYTIRSTGRSGAEVRTVVTEVVQLPININIKGAMAASVDVKFTGNAVVCGYNHKADTPVGTGSNGRAGAGGCNESAGQWETGADNKTGIWSTGTISANGGAQDFGTPPEQPTQGGFYAGPWEALGMTQAAFYAWVGARQATAPANPDGILYLDNNTTTQDQSGSYSYNGGTGSGFMYVDGDLTLNSSFNYRGMIYVEGDLKMNGQAWVLGAIIVKGKAQLKNNGGATMLYSYDAVQQSIAKWKGGFMTLSWHEL